MLPLVGAALSGGLSLLSGFGAQSSAKKQQKMQLAMDEFARRYNADRLGEYNSEVRNLGERLLETPQITQTSTRNSSWVDVDSMMLDAQRAGFNPVTWLNAGGMQAYTQSQADGWQSQTDPVAAFQMMMPQLQQIQASQAVNIPSTMSVIGDAGQAALKSFQTDQRLLDSQAFQEKMLGIKLDSIQKGQKQAFSGFGSTPRMSSSGSNGFGSIGGLTGTAGALTQSKPQEVTPSLTGYSEPGSNPIIQYFDNGSGGYMIGQAGRYKEASEEDMAATLSWNVANRFLPMLGINQKPPAAMLYGSERWYYDPVYQSYMRTTEPKATWETHAVAPKVTKVPDDTPNSLTINGYQIWPFWK